MVFDRLGSLVSRRWVLVLLFWVVLVAGVHQVAPRWDDVTHDGDFAYLPDRMTSVRGEKLLEAGFPDFFSKSQVALVIAREDGQLGEPDFEVAHRLEAAFPASDDPNEPITAAWSFETPVIGDKLLSPVTDNGQAALVVLHLRNEFMAIDNMELLRRIHQALADVQSEPGFPPGLKLGLTGSAAVGSDMLFSAEESIRSTETTTIVLVVVILLLVYRAPGLVVVPLVTIGASVVLAMDLVAMTTQLSDYFTWFDFKIFKTTRIFVVVILYGAGTDFCLFLIARYREELQRGLAHPRGDRPGIGPRGQRAGGQRDDDDSRAGHDVLRRLRQVQQQRPGHRPVPGGHSGGVRQSGSGDAAGQRAGGLLAVRRRNGDDRGPRDHGLRRPHPRILGVVEPGDHCPTRADPDRQPPRARAADPAGSRALRERGRRGTLPAAIGNSRCRSVTICSATCERIGRACGERISCGITFPPTRPVRSRSWRIRNGEDFDSQEGRRKIALLTKELSDFTLLDAEGREVHPIVSVRSLTEPMGDKPGSFSPLSAAGRRKLLSLRYPKTVATFVSQTPPLAGQLTRFDVVSIYAPFSKESVELLNRIEERLKAKAAEPDSPWQGAEFDFVGTTAGIRDLEAVTDQRPHANPDPRADLRAGRSDRDSPPAAASASTWCSRCCLGYYVTIGTTDLLVLLAAPGRRTPAWTGKCPSSCSSSSSPSAKTTTSTSPPGCSRSSGGSGRSRGCGSRWFAPAASSPVAASSWPARSPR